MKRAILGLLLGAAMIIPEPAIASDSTPELLTLEKAVEKAVTGDWRIRSAASRLAAAQWRAKQASSGRLPRVHLTEAYTRTNNPAEAFGLSLSQERFDFNAFVSSDPNRPDAIDNFMTRLEVIQPLYTGGELSARIRQGSLAAEAEGLGLERTREQVAFDAASSFIDLANARQYLFLANKARDTTAAHVELARQYRDAGILVESDYLKATVHLARMEEQVTRAESGARLAEAALNFNLGQPQDTPRILSTLPSIPQSTEPLGDWEERAVATRLDLRSARTMLAAGELEEKAARAGFFPQIALVGRYDLYDDIPFGGNGDSGAVMVMAKLNLFSGGERKAQIEAARETVFAHREDIKRFEQGIRLEVRQAYLELDAARKHFEAAHSSLGAAREAMRVTEERFEQGVDRMIDLLDAETALHEAEVSELAARHDIYQAALRLRFAAGESLLIDEFHDPGSSN